MQAKLNIVLKLVKEVGLTVGLDSPFNKLAGMQETDRLRLNIEDLNDEYGVNEDLCDEFIQKLNEIKKKNFEIKSCTAERVLVRQLN